MSPAKLHIGTILATVILLTGACRDVVGPPSSFFGDDCQETESPVNFGCVDIQGTVSNSRGQPLANIDVALVDPAPGLGPDFVTTDQGGMFELRLLALRNLTEVSFVLKATARRSDGTEISHVTMPVTVTVTPIGETPEPVTVNFTIPGT